MQMTSLSVLSYANGFTLWHYRTTDTASTVRTPEYFAPARDMLRANDLIIINAIDENFQLFVSA